MELVLEGGIGVGAGARVALELELGARVGAGQGVRCHLSTDDLEKLEQEKMKRSLKLGCVGTSARPVLTTLPGSRMSGSINIKMANKILQCELGVQNCQ
jgi:hypothetical protein